MELGLWIALLGAITVVAIICGVFINLIKNKEKYRAQAYEQEEKRLNDEGELVTVHAEVVDMECGVNTVGHKEPKAVKHFTITFRCDDGELIHLSVPEVFYTGFDIGLVGTLSLVDGQLKSFELDANHE